MDRELGPDLLRPAGSRSDQRLPAVARPRSASPAWSSPPGCAIRSAPPGASAPAGRAPLAAASRPTRAGAGPDRGVQGPPAGVRLPAWGPSQSSRTPSAPRRTSRASRGPGAEGSSPAPESARALRSSGTAPALPVSAPRSARRAPWPARVRAIADLLQNQGAQAHSSARDDRSGCGIPLHHVFVRDAFAKCSSISSSEIGARQDDPALAVSWPSNSAATMYSSPRERLLVEAAPCPFRSRYRPAVPRVAGRSGRDRRTPGAHRRSDPPAAAPAAPRIPAGPDLCPHPSQRLPVDVRPQSCLPAAARAESEVRLGNTVMPT